MIDFSTKPISFCRRGLKQETIWSALYEETWFVVLLAFDVAESTWCDCASAPHRTIKLSAANQVKKKA